MKTTHKKKKKRGTRKSNRSINRSIAEPKTISKVQSNPEAAVKDEKRKRDQIVPKRVVEKKTEKPNQFVRYFGIAVQFLRDARTELKKVKWPTRKELLASTVIVIVLVLAVALFLGLIDIGLMKILKGIVG